MRDALNLMQEVQGTYVDAGVQMGTNTAVSKGVSNVYGTTGYNIFDVPFDERVKTEFFTGGNVISQEITLAAGETIYAYGASAVDAGGASPYSYNEFEVDLEVYILNTTPAAFDGTNLLSLPTLSYADGSTFGTTDLWSDGTSYTNSTGSDVKLIVAFTYYGNLDNEVEGLIGRDVYLYLSKLRDPYTVPLPSEVLATTFTGPLVSSTTSTGNSFAAGEGLISQWSGSTALGKYNIGESTDNILEVGGGTSDVARSNILELTLSGDLILPAQPSPLTPNSVATKAFIDPYITKYDTLSDFTHNYVDTVKTKNVFTKLYASDAAASQQFGSSVAASDTKFVIGAYRDDDVGGLNVGAAYIYDSDSTNEIKVMPSTPTAEDGFGTSVAINSTKVAAGSPSDDDNGSGAGAVYLYGHDGLGELKIIGSDVVAGNKFGSVVHLTNTKLFTSAVAQGSGVVYSYNLDGTGEVKITPSDVPNSQYWGNAIATNSTKVAIGHRLNDTGSYNSGAVYIYDLNGTNELKITPSVAYGEGLFGSSIAMTDTKIYIGCPGSDEFGANAGAVYIYNLDGSGETIITSSDSSIGNNYGESVSINSTNLVVGTKNSRDADNNYKLYVYDLDGTNESLIHTTETASSKYIGKRVALSNTSLVVGHEFDTNVAVYAGAAYIFDATDLGSKYIDSDMVHTTSNGTVNLGTLLDQMQAATAGHTHTGVYEPADGTILKDADIGVTVQGYDATNLNEASVKNDLISTDINKPLSANQGLVLKGFIDSINTTLGTKSDTSHNHTGVYEPADATILKDADIGITVQGYDATTVNTAYLLSAEFGNSLPIADPLVIGKLWNNAGVLTISAG